ncbi:MAG: ATP-binding cassette domain-containing protein [Rubrivivax sp.]|jgi:ABC-type multidrug transport system ATPase subunit|nr:ATP-binding cassette domain-containing protein [Rubrivivax sp.]
MQGALSDPVLQVRHLSFAHPGQAALFDDWSADLHPGVTLLDGEMASGKTTLLRLLAADLQGRGELRLRGRRCEDDPAAYRQQLCFFDVRDPGCDALTPVGLMQALRQRHPLLDEQGWQHHLAAFDLLPHRDKPLYALSTGSRQKAGLAVALSAECALTLLDEPTRGLDAASADHLMRSLTALAPTSTASAGAARRALLVVCSAGLDRVTLTGTLRLP